jgi:hypothetical protein
MFDEREPAEPELTPDLQAIESQLARLTPVAAQVDRDRLMFEAGRVAARPSRLGRLDVARWPGYIAGPSWHAGLVWPAMTTLTTAASLLLAVSLIWQRHSLEVALKERSQQTISVAQVGEQRPAEASSTNTRPSLATAEWMYSRQPVPGYLRIRYAALTRGVNAIDTGPANSGVGDSTGALDQTQREMLDELLPSAKSKKHSKS